MIMVIVAMMKLSRSFQCVAESAYAQTHCMTFRACDEDAVLQWHVGSNAFPCLSDLEPVPL